MNWYKQSKKYNNIPGGRADSKQPKDFNKKELEHGISIEQEHTSNKDIATEITMDHLLESEDYYIELEKMEKKLKGE